MGKGLGPTQGLSIEIRVTEAAQMVQRPLLNATPMESVQEKKKRGKKLLSLWHKIPDKEQESWEHQLWLDMTKINAFGWKESHMLGMNLAWATTVKDGAETVII